jgi:hypothetical protein
MGHLNQNWLVEYPDRIREHNSDEVRFKFLALGNICGTALMVHACRHRDGKYQAIEFDRDELRSLLKELRRALPLEDRVAFARETLRELDEPAFLQFIATLCQERVQKISSGHSTSTDPAPQPAGR